MTLYRWAILSLMVAAFTISHTVCFAQAQTKVEHPVALITTNQLYPIDKWNTSDYASTMPVGLTLQEQFKWRLNQDQDVRSHSMSWLHSAMLQGASVLDHRIPNDTYDLMQLVVGKGALVNSRDDSGETPLIRAIWDHNVVAIRFLLTHGADANTPFCLMKPSPEWANRHAYGGDWPMFGFNSERIDWLTPHTPLWIALKMRQQVSGGSYKSVGGFSSWSSLTTPPGNLQVYMAYTDIMALLKQAGAKQ